MINETVILVSPFEDLSSHRLAKYWHQHLMPITPVDRYFYEPLRQIFSTVIVYDVVKQITEIGIKVANEELVRLVRKEHPKYVFRAYLTYEIIESTFERIRQEGTLVVSCFTDDEYYFDWYTRWWIPYVDYCVTFDIEAVPKYQALGARVIHAKNTIGTPVDRDWSKIEEKYEVSYVGEKRWYREQDINELKERNIPVSVFGPGWGEQTYKDRFVPYDEMIDIFKTSKINLNFARAGDSNRMGIKARVFEVCLAGGFLLTEYAPGIEKYFETDKEIVCFHNTEEMIDKVNYYLSHDIERRAIAQAGWQRAISSGYTPDNMVSLIFDEIEKDLASTSRDARPTSPKPKMPRAIRNLHSQYFFQWGRAFSEENYKGLWKDALALAISYNPLNSQAWYYYILGFLPYSVRLSLMRIAGVVRNLCRKSYRKLMRWADSMPYLRDIKRSVAKRYCTVEGNKE